MNELQIFNHPDFGEVRTIDDNGTILFCGNDVVKALGYSNPRDALARHCRGVVKHDGVSLTTNQHGTTTKQKTEMSFIPESDLYRLVFSSKLPTAEKFTDWVTSEVLPSIRKHGAYLTPETLQAAILNPDIMIQLCQKLKNEQEKNRELSVTNSRLTVENQIMQPKAEYFDELVDRNLLTNFRETAKELDCKPKKFVEFLIERKYISRDKRGKLLPYENKNDGLFVVRECFNEKTQWSGTQTMVTPKGRETFRLLLA